MSMISRYTFKDLRMINNLSIEELSCKTLIPSETLAVIKVDSSNISRGIVMKLAEFYRISVDYIFIGKQSTFVKMGGKSK
ncbi:helix-turn-helix transcriptional regulator [Lactococcus garvieae]|uniref:helix-turn-helix domain-containing protein n=1 Tax=Lactococcus garvieae TaxID=1363 RepID=UPI001F6062D2|nr:helix-turn-helix transcriptional regulator [Lactococcus garvieae]MCI3861089.1 helix-turn-helix domain-containing protein [Lactococcus garvieae]